MERILIAILFLVFAPAAFAASVQIRAGEHEGFTRLVFNLPERTGWVIKPTESGREIKFNSPNLSFEHARVFSKISRERLSELRFPEGTSSVLLELSCECKVETFWHSGTMLVLDIRDGPDRNSQSGATTTLTDAAKPTAMVTELSPQRQKKGSTSSVLAVAQLEQLRDITDLDARMETEATRSEEFRDMRDRLTQQVVRAASQGLLSLLEGKQKIQPEVSLPQNASSAPVRAEIEPRPKTTRHAGANARIQTVIDRDLIQSRDRSSDAEASQRCLKEDELDVRTWASSAEFSAQLGRIRGRLVSELDEAEPARLDELARFYLYFGFGAEAGQVVELISPVKSDLDVLRSLADIMDTGHANAMTPLSNQLHCDSSVALWSALSYQELPQGHEIDTDAILRAFNSLPKHLRIHVGPDLARRFLSAGDHETADRLLSILGRVSKQATLAAADLAMAKGNPDLAETHLEEIVTEGKHDAATALVRIIETKLLSDAAISEQEVELVSAYAKELSNVPLSSVLGRSVVLATAATGQFTLAFSELAQRKPSFSDSDLRELQNRLFSLLSQKADDVTFLRHAIPRAEAREQHFTLSTTQEIAERLLDLGFPEVAKRYVENRETANLERETQTLLARLALAQNDPGLAERELTGLSGKDIDLLTAKARALAGDYEAASRFFLSAADSTAADRAAILSETLMEKNGNVAHDLGTRRSSTTSGHSDDAETLSNRNRSLIAASQEAREAVSTLLSNFELPAE